LARCCAKPAVKFAIALLGQWRFGAGFFRIVVAHRFRRVLVLESERGSKGRVPNTPLCDIGFYGSHQLKDARR
jgi:hypothetical protein